jgi:hypothetical protein
VDVVGMLVVVFSVDVRVVEGEVIVLVSVLVTGTLLVEVVVVVVRVDVRKLDVEVNVRVVLADVYVVSAVKV